MITSASVSDFPSAYVGTSAIPDRVPKVLPPDESAESSLPTDGSKSDGDTAVSATVKLLRGMRDSLDPFIGPLKSVAGSLCFILENCEVLPLSHTSDLYTYGHSSERMWTIKR